MARPLRLEVAGAVYFVSSHCPEGSVAFRDREDALALEGILAQAMRRFDAQVLAYCLLPNRYELLLFTRQANLSRLMRHVIGVYTQNHQRRHGAGGALFQGRFRAVLVDREAHLLDACRAVELAPLQAGLVKRLKAWPHSSLPAHLGLAPAPEWLDVDGLHGHLLGRPPRSPHDHRRAAASYEALLRSEPDFDLWTGRLRRQIFLGDATFVERMLRASSTPPPEPSARQVRAQWQHWSARYPDRAEALFAAHFEGGLSMTSLAREAGLSVSRVSRIIAEQERQ